MVKLLTSTFVCFSAFALTAAPQLHLSGTTVGPIYVEAGSNAPAQTINAFNLGDGSLNLAIASSSGSWLSGSVGQPTSCSTGPVAACIPVAITLNTAGLTIGTYTESLTLVAPNAIDAPQTITVTVQVNGAPTSVDFYVTPNTGAATAQSATAFLTVNTGGSVISTVKTADNGSWLNFVLFNGNQVVYTGYQVRVTAQVGQAEGTYTGMVILSGSTNSSDNKTINVNLHVTSQPILQIPSSPITFSLVQGQAPITENINFQNLGLGALAVSGATTTGIGLSAAATGGSAASITADPTQLSPGSYFGAITLTSNGANTSVAIPIRVNVAAPGNPIAFFNGVVDNAAFVAGQSVGSGSVAAVFGTQLSSSPPAYASGFPLPTMLGGVQVLISGNPVPLFYADANQVDIQVPFNLSTGQVQVQVVRSGQPGNLVTATVDSTAPRIFALGLHAPDGTPYGVLLNADNTLALPANLVPGAHPAHLGAVITIYALGLGPVSPSVITGEPAPSNEPLARITSQIQVMYGSGAGAVMVNPTYAGLAPGLAGLYQINVLIPVTVPSGNVPVSIVMPGHNSNLVEMAAVSQ